MVQVIAGVIEKEGKILIAKRSVDTRFAGKWEFPGGKLEEGESHEACLKREIKEECNIDVDVKNKICFNRFDYGDLQVEVILYHSVYRNGELLNTEHEATHWILPNDLPQYDFLEANIPLVSQIQEYFNQ